MLTFEMIDHRHHVLELRDELREKCVQISDLVQGFFFYVNEVCDREMQERCEWGFNGVGCAGREIVRGHSLTDGSAILTGAVWDVLAELLQHACIHGIPVDTWLSGSEGLEACLSDVERITEELEEIVDELNAHAEQRCTCGTRYCGFVTRMDPNDRLLRANDGYTDAIEAFWTLVRQSTDLLIEKIDAHGGDWMLEVDDSYPTDAGVYMVE